MPSILPLVSILTPSLNTGRYLKDTLRSISKQNYGNIEHIVVDGGSTDETLEILQSYSEVKWISRVEGPESTIAEAYREAFTMSCGKYIFQCCISDGYLDQEWISTCVDTLEANPDISLVYGLPQNMSEEGTFGRVAYHEFFDDPPPSGRDFLAFWLGTGFLFPEGNYCVRREVFDKCYFTNQSDDPFMKHSALGFVYGFVSAGYLPLFIPRIANFGRIHYSRQIWNRANETPIDLLYSRMVKDYAKSLYSGQFQHHFRNGSSVTIGKIEPSDLSQLRRSILRHRIARKKLFRRDLYTIYRKLCVRYPLLARLIGRYHHQAIRQAPERF